MTLIGTIPVMKTIDMSGVKECDACHPEPIKEELIVASTHGELKNVIVSLKTAAGLKIPLPVPTEPGVLTQRGCQYLPHVLPVMLGQTVIVKNDDPFLHNVHGVTDLNDPPFLTQPTKDPGQKLPAFTAVETFKIKCDVHPWMAAWVRILDNPYFAVTADDGTYEIKGLPDGSYTLTAWQEQLARLTSRSPSKPAGDRGFPVQV